MSVRSGQSITVDFVTCRFDTGVATAADSTPTGTLVVNGTDDAASVTVTSKTGGKYKAAVTLPTLAIGDVVQIRIAATVNSVAGIGVVWTDTKDVALDSDGKVTVPDTQKVDLNTIKTQTVTCAAGVTVLASVGTAGTSIAQSADNNTILANGTYGLSALKTLIDAVSAKTTNLPSDPADQSELAALIAALSSQLNSAVWAQTRFRFSIPESLEIPESGANTYTLGIATYDSSGALTNCDSTPTINAFYADGTSANALLGAVASVGTGLYSLTLSVASTVSGPLFVRFVGTAAMSSVNIGMTDYTWLMDDVAPDFSSTDRTKLTTLYDDWVDGGRLDLILDARASQSSLSSLITTVGVAGLGLSDIPWNASWDAEVQSECADAINAYDPPTNAEMEARTLAAASYATAANQTTILTNLATANTALAKFTTMVVQDGAVWQYTANALELGPGGGDTEVDSFSAGALAQLAALREINVHGAVVSEGQINGIVIGDDYLTEDGRQLQFVNAAGSWQNLTGATVTLTLIGETEVDIAAIVITPSGANQRVDVDLTTTITTALTVNYKTYRLKAVLSNGNIVRLEEGTVNVQA